MLFLLRLVRPLKVEILHNIRVIQILSDTKFSISLSQQLLNLFLVLSLSVIDFIYAILIQTLNLTLVNFGLCSLSNDLLVLDIQVLLWNTLWAVENLRIILRIQKNKSLFQLLNIVILALRSINFLYFCRFIDSLFENILSFCWRRLK